MEKLDVRGLSCPIPVVKTKKLIDKGAQGITILGDSSVAMENVSKLAASCGYKIDMKKSEKNDWEMEISK